jgi:hypothetical protein
MYATGPLGIVFAPLCLAGAGLRKVGADYAKNSLQQAVFYILAADESPLRPLDHCGPLQGAQHNRMWGFTVIEKN